MERHDDKVMKSVGNYSTIVDAYLAIGWGFVVSFEDADDYELHVWWSSGI